MQLTEQTIAKGQVIIGAGLMSTPWWATALQSVTLIASAVAAICGAIIGVCGVVQLWRKRMAGRADAD